ncbi:acetolactate synthase 2 catalytic subunit [Pseudocolwellia sp. AS88]|jgi:acetolactate synthase-1/2/3 large subunit|uniref:acetolactate synthase 2 catalytic subunit n=1 Tax=Pseudocolwellia TaxID=2848177 RepID=UPI0026F2525E|nr:acetolactate synthase 2 catalytic subunit [Pseudocolwellia sp. AS88]MDO7083860.1 acetolactate synthase 2 catalytic subunit [Pseudocolwellia sp. AS88]
MASDQKHTGGSLLFAVLQEHGVKHVFGYPGGAIMPIYDALYDSDVEHYLCRHEQGAAFAAVGYARASDKVGVCMATSGPGATNLITGLADALADSIPIVAITGQVPTAAMGSDAFQEIDVFGLSLACTKHSFQVTDINDLAGVLHQAFAIALEGRQGPVLVDIPKDIQMAEINCSLDDLSQLPNKVKLPPVDVTQAISLLSQAKKPILYVGGGVGMANAIDELREFCDKTGMPCVSTLKGLGAISPENENYLGMLGMHGTKASNLAVQESDLLVVVGARFDDRVTGKLDEFAPNAKVIHFDIDTAEINKRRKADSAILGDLKINLPALAIPLSITEWQKQCQANKAEFAWRYDHPGENIYAPAVLKEISDTMPKNTCVTTDVGQHQMWAAQHMLFNDPSDWLTSGGMGTMGFGLPAAIGAQVSRPTDCVIAVSGDGSFMMNVQELATIKRFQLPVKILLIDNAKLGMVRQWQDLFFNGRLSETDLSDNPDFIMLANAFDIKAKEISKKSEVTAAIAEMLDHDGPYLLKIKIDAEDNVWPLVPPNTANDKMMESI